MKYLELVNLDKYQHYQTGRETIWIKVYLKITSDYKFQQLTDSERWLFIGLIMIAVECSNSIPEDALWVYRRVCYGNRKGAYRVAIGVKKMLKIGLLSQKNAIMEKYPIRAALTNSSKMLVKGLSTALKVGGKLFSGML